MLIMVTGGARSGKSSFAESYVSGLGQRGIYIATAQAYDEEMKERIGLHRQQREAKGFVWRTIEEPFALASLLTRWSGSLADGGLDAGKVTIDAALVESDGYLLTEKEALEQVEETLQGSVVLVDCLTLWLSNWLLRYEQEPDVEERLQRKLDELVKACKQFTDSGRHLVLVTNEVGCGLVPEYKLGRQFRDVSGMMNQRLAREAEKVFLVISGIPVEIKSRQFRWRRDGIGD